jgi:intracellular septation protein
MQLLIDFIPIIVFFVVYRIYGMYAATAAIIVAMALQIGYQWLRHRKVNTMLLASGAFLGSQLFTAKTLTERMMGHAMELDAALWRQLNLMWVINFFVLGCANLYVVYNFDEATWVNFKLFGMVGLSLLTAVGQAIWISSRSAQRDAEKGP